MKLILFLLFASVTAYGQDTTVIPQAEQMPGRGIDSCYDCGTFAGTNWTWTPTPHKKKKRPNAYYGLTFGSTGALKSVHPGDLVYFKDSASYCFWNGSGWTRLSEQISGHEWGNVPDSLISDSARKARGDDSYMAYDMRTYPVSHWYTSSWALFLYGIVVGVLIAGSVVLYFIYHGAKKLDV